MVARNLQAQLGFALQSLDLFTNSLLSCIKKKKLFFCNRPRPRFLHHMLENSSSPRNIVQIFNKNFKQAVIPLIGWYFY